MAHLTVDSSADYKCFRCSVVATHWRELLLRRGVGAFAAVGSRGRLGV